MKTEELESLLKVGTKIKIGKSERKMQMCGRHKKTNRNT